MSLPTYTPPANDHGDDSLRAFLATVQAAADYDLDEMTQGPRAPHRLNRKAAEKQAIEASEKEGF